MARQTLDGSERDRGQHPADFIADADAADRRIIDPIAEAMLEHLQPEFDRFALHIGKPAEFRAFAIADDARPSRDTEKVPAHRPHLLMHQPK